MDLSIIIPSFNTKSLLDRCLKSIVNSLRSSNMQYEVIVVDNASEDGTRELLRTKYPRVKTILSNGNFGYSKSNNLAIKEVSGKYILLLNSDTVALNDAIKRLLIFSKNHSKAFVGGKLFNEDMTPQSSCGPFFSLPVVALILFVKGDYWGATRYSPGETKRVDWVSGACIMGQKSSFLDVGLFDENIFMYMEDIEFLYRARKKGYTTLFYPVAQFVHTGAASSGSRRTPVVNIYRGLTYFYKKHTTPSAIQILQYMLQLKALLAIQIGRIMRRKDLMQIYEEALSIR